MEKEQQTQKTTAKKVAGIVLNVLLWIFLAFAFLMMVFAFASVSNDYNVPVMGKKVIMNVVTESMEPVIKKGSLIVGTTLTDEEKAALKEGDIITFFVDLNGDGAKELNTHRIKIANYGGEPGTFKTQGDNNPAEDDYVIRYSDIVCKWEEGDAQLRGIGSAFGFLQSRTGFLVIVVLPLALFFVYEVIRLVLSVLKIKNADKRVITVEDEEEIRRKAIEDYLKSQKAESETPSENPAETGEEQKQE
ncbi:MAG: signal peptidase I [Clostridia bacterium]|nr:signal peptidase I [Clostridia bacterium]